MNPLPTLSQDISGNGPALVVLHGLFGDADNFRSIALHLERYFQVIRLDLPGHGKSPHLSPMSFQNMAQAVHSHLADEGVSRCHLLGHSLGGKVAMQMAGNSQDLLIEKLVVVDIAPKLYPAHHTVILDALSQLPLNELKNRSDADKRLQGTITDAGVRGFLLKSLHRDADGQYGWRFDLNGIRNDYELIRQPPDFAEVVQCPSLFIKGGNSDYISHGDELPIRKNFRNPKFKEIAGTGHWPHAEKPALFARLCLEFLNS